MKKIILILFSIALGVYLFAMIVGDAPNSLKTSSKTIMEKQIETLKSIP